MADRIGERLALVQAMVEDGYEPDEIAAELSVEVRLVEALLRTLRGESMRRGPFGEALLEAFVR